MRFSTDVIEFAFLSVKWPLDQAFCLFLSLAFILSQLIESRVSLSLSLIYLSFGYIQNTDFSLLLFFQTAINKFV